MAKNPSEKLTASDQLPYTRFPMSSSEWRPIRSTPVEFPAGFAEPSPPPARVIDPNNPPWGTLLAFVTWVASIVLLVFVPILTALPYMFYRATTGGMGPPEALLRDKNFIFFSILGVIPAHLLTWGVAWAVVTRFGRYPFWKTLGWQWPVSFGPWKSVVVGLGLLLIGLIITHVIGGSKTELEELINSSYRTRVATAILAATTGPLVEEVVYRGVLYSALQRALGMIWSILVVSVLFAGVHVYQYKSNAGVIAVISLLSITLTVVRAYTGRLLPCFVIHLVFNGVQSILLVVQPFFEKADQILPQKAPAYLIARFLTYFT